MKRIIQLGSLLGAFCVVFGVLLAFVYIITKPQIEFNAKKNLEDSLKEVLPKASLFKRLNINSNEAFEGKTKEETVGYILLQSPKGYSGKIEMLIGIDSKSSVSRVKILTQTETPGLGANVVSEKFLKQFIGKTVKNKLEAKKDIDAITGATISSKAVCSGVKEALQDFSKLK